MKTAHASTTPAGLGYRMPAEWEPHAATWLSWPHNRESWPGKFKSVEPAYAEIVRALAESETVHINVLDAAHEKRVDGILHKAGIVGDIRLHRYSTNDAWCRDHGAIFVVRPGRDAPLAAVHCGYNAWGGKYPPYDRDALIPERMAEFLRIPRFLGGMILEGGSIEPNGAGAMLTTEQCLLNPNRNPHLSRPDIERRLHELFNVSQLLWLGDGIVGDDTDGHIDDLARFTARDTVVTVIEDNAADENYRPLRENRERLARMRLADGSTLKVAELPMPAPKYFAGQRLPASYANFYIANKSVLLPVFGDPMDAESERILKPLFPGRKIVPVQCLDLVLGLGTVHCLTQQVPAVSDA
ncbi:MAG: agmatine deiminase family protein [Gammaproteobacteria bacterium]|nr:agmatine deiminase family protein [Gammaproteobacteria bacterium]